MDLSDGVASMQEQEESVVNAPADLACDGRIRSAGTAMRQRDGRLGRRRLVPARKRYRVLKRMVDFGALVGRRLRWRLVLWFLVFYGRHGPLVGVVQQAEVLRHLDVLLAGFS